MEEPPSPRDGTPTEANNKTSRNKIPKTIETEEPEPRKDDFTVFNVGHGKRRFRKFINLC